MVYLRIKKLTESFEGNILMTHSEFYINIRSGYHKSISKETNVKIKTFLNRFEENICELQLKNFEMKNSLMAFI